MVEFKPIHTYTVNLGKCKGDYKLYWDFDPTNSGSAVPCRAQLKWGNIILDTGFRGDSSYNSDLVSLGYLPVFSGNTNGFLTLTKNNIEPSIAEITVYTPLEESLFQTNMICPEECLGAPSTPLFLSTGLLYEASPGQYTTSVVGQPAGVRVSWNEPENVGESQIEKYVVEYKYDNGNWTFFQTLNADQRSINVTGLSGDIFKYVFRVAGINSSGTGSFINSVPISNSSCFNTIYYHVNDNINQDSDVYTIGEYVAAYNIGGTDTATVNGVAFIPTHTECPGLVAPFQNWFCCPGGGAAMTPGDCGVEGPYYLPTQTTNIGISQVGSQELKITTSGSLKNGNSLVTNSLPFFGLGSDYKYLLSSAVSSSQTNLLLEVNNLEVGAQYLIQLWCNVSKQSEDVLFGVTQVSGFDVYGANINVDLNNNLNYIEGSLGKNIVGTFVSCGTDLKINIQGLAGIPPVVNALQIRKIVTKACCKIDGSCTLHSPNAIIEECCEYDSYLGEYDCSGRYIADNCWMCAYYLG